MARKLTVKAYEGHARHIYNRLQELEDRLELLINFLGLQERVDNDGDPILRKRTTLDS